MTNPRVLLEYVPLVRRLMAMSEDPDVAGVGRLGEITYLVDEHVSQAELEVLDALIASQSSQAGRAVASRRLQEHRDALAKHLGKHLLKAGMQCASRQYEIYVDPTTETIVHLLGFRRPDPLPEELADAPAADQARWIFDHPGDTRADGQRVVEHLLAGRDVAELSCDELLLLAKGYNWAGQNAKALEIAKGGLARDPHSNEWLSLARIYVWNTYFRDLPRYLSACDACIAAGIGPAAFWHLLKAGQYTAIATGELELEDFQWTPADPIRHPELLRPAAESLQAALACHPRLLEDQAAREWVGDWNDRFAAVLQEPAFKHLAREV
jgi:hypothetical protein